MQVSENWLREWVNPAATAAEMAHKLNLAGIEAETSPLPAEALDQVVVGRILTAVRHPQADRLQVCTVDTGSGTPSQIVCGAANARPGLVVPVALPGALLPGGVAIKAAQLRGVDSAGMLCSAKELGLSEKSEGLLELDDTAPLGKPIRDYLQLVDGLITLELTPNRGDCLSIAGLARELGALYALPSTPPPVVKVDASSTRALTVNIEEPRDCSCYSGRIIEGIRADSRTPDWMREKLRRSGIRSIHPVVDITNYVMLERGQPLHAFDLARLAGEQILVRRARAGESLKVLDGSSISLRNELLITAADQPVALAGVMGGLESGVIETTTDIFLESAAFAPAAIAGTARRHKLSSDAAYRFERGVDPLLNRSALERATALVLEICGGRAGPVVQAGATDAQAAVPLRLRRDRLTRLLGVELPDATVEKSLVSLGVTVQRTTDGEWACQPPSWRFDLAIEQDLIEEVARLYGYDRIPAKPYSAALIPPQQSELKRPISRIRDVLVARGWQEAVTYSFVDPRVQAQLTPDVDAIVLDNPIAETMSVMRTTLWTGLMGAWLHNHQRQSRRVRLFECASTFERKQGQIVETPRLAGLAYGPVFQEQWGQPARSMDFYDLKADVEALCMALGGGSGHDRFESAHHPVLHPGRSAVLKRGGQSIGFLGELHPEWVNRLDLPGAPLLFELDWQLLSAAVLPQAAPVPEFPASRRDLAVVLAEATPVQQVIDVIRQTGEGSLTQVLVFDIYRGQGLREGSKSVALGLIFQDYSRTLTVEEIDSQMAVIVQALADQTGAIVRA